MAERFGSAFAGFADFLRENDLAEPKLTQGEVTYVNHIFPVDGVWTSHGEAEKAVTLLGKVRGSFLPAPEDVRLSARYVIVDSGGSAAGRLHVVVEPRFLVQDDRPLLLLQLTARGAPIGEGLEGAREFFDLGREWIVKGFVEVTSAEMHRQWGGR